MSPKLVKQNAAQNALCDSIVEALGKHQGMPPEDVSAVLGAALALVAMGGKMALPDVLDATAQSIAAVYGVKITTAAMQPGGKG